VSCSRCVVLRADSFYDWLVEHPAQVVGRPGCENDCPIARWVSSLLGVPCEVTGDGYLLQGSDEVHSIPSWVQTFTRLVDFAFPLDEVTDEQALYFLHLATRDPLGIVPARPLLSSQLIPFDGVQVSGPIGGRLL